MHLPRVCMRLALPLAFVSGCPAPATALAANAPESLEVTVYFENGRAELTPEANTLLINILPIAAGPSRRIVVTGHSDRLGSRLYNLFLSRRRAREVGDALVDLGVAASVIVLRWSGETMVPYPTDDEMREPLNRCVIITIETVPS